MRRDYSHVHAAVSGVSERRGEIEIGDKVGRGYITVAFGGVYKVYIVVFAYLFLIKGLGTVPERQNTAFLVELFVFGNEIIRIIRRVLFRVHIEKL